MSTTTHINKQRTEGIINPLLVQKHFELSEMEHKEFIYTLGCQFLNNYFGAESKSIGIVERSIYYWKWWKIEYLRLEQIFINHINERGIECSKENYFEAMSIFSRDLSPAESFATFLKVYKVKIHGSK